MSRRKITEFRTVALALATLLLLAVAANPQPAQAPMQTPPATLANNIGCAAGAAELEPTRKLALAGVPNFGEATDTLLRGGQPMPQGFAELQKLGVQVVVNFRKQNNEAERTLVEALGLEYVSLPWNCHSPNNEAMAQFLELVRDHPNKKIFVHCHYGIDRTGMMVAAYRIAEQGWTAEQARREMEQFGFNFIHSSWCHQLKSYEADFPAQLASDPKLQQLRTAQAISSPCAR